MVTKILIMGAIVGVVLVVCIFFVRSIPVVPENKKKTYVIANLQKFKLKEQGKPLYGKNIYLVSLKKMGL